MRQKVVNQLETLLKDISVANGYQTDFADVRIWDDIPTEYGVNEIILKDTRAKFEKKNNYTATVRVQIIAIVIETATRRAGVEHGEETSPFPPAPSASELGNIALEDLIEAVLKLNVCKSIVTLVDTYKFIQTKGKTACEVELNIDVKYQF